jgi:hypothetical protein
MEFYVPFHIWDVILPIDELHHFSEVLKPPTRSMFASCAVFVKALKATGVDSIPTWLDQFPE